MVKHEPFPNQTRRLPESGLGMFIIRELMDVEYRPGRPNVLVLSKKLDTHSHRVHSGGARGALILDRHPHLCAVLLGSHRYVRSRR
jgi:hypothetical protein